jgi:hypothetical protein
MERCDECGENCLVDGVIDGAIALDGRLIGRCCMTPDERAEHLRDECPEGGLCYHPQGAQDCPGFQEGSQGCAYTSPREAE